MEIQSAFNAGLQGFQRASAGVTEATIDINRQTSSNRQQATDTELRQAEAPDQVQPSQRQVPSVEQSLVQLNSESRNAEANVRSIQAADEALGTIIDVRV